MRRLLAAFAAAGLATACGAAAERGAAATVPPPTATTVADTARWRSMAAAPLEGRIHPAAVWTGHELIVVGGFRDDVAQPGESVDAFTSDGRQLHFTSFVDGRRTTRRRTGGARSLTHPALG